MIEVASSEPRSGLPLLIVAILAPILLLGFFLLANERGSDFLLVGIMSICFLALAAAFLFAGGSIGTQWCTAPGFMTILASASFVIAPLWRFAVGDDQVDVYHVRAMAYVLAGFSVFWATCWMLRKPSRLAFVPARPSGDLRILLGATALFAMGTTTKIISWELGIVGYLAASMQADVNVSLLGLLDAANQMLNMSMLISGIEVFGKRSSSLAMRLLFGTSFALTLGFALVSGLKFDVVMPLLTLTLMLGIIYRRLPRLFWALPVIFALVLPWVNAYRRNLNAGYSAQINTLGGLTDAVAKSVEDLAPGRNAHQAGTADFKARLSFLSLFHDVLQLPSPELLNGDEKVWLAPIYPFIPRPLWKAKPMFDKGHRMSEAMGISRLSSTNIPGPADLYLLGGLPGVLFGMFVWGAILQLFMNSIARNGFSERGTFFYVMVLFSITTLERDIVAMIGGAIVNVIILFFVSRLVYGGRLFSVT